jgi:hypothetical protein
MSNLNDLNSILLEGTVSGKPCVDGEGEAKRCSFVVSSLRYVENGENTRKQETRVCVMVRNSAMVQAVLKHVYDGRNLRIVGWIAVDEDGCVYIEAEHVEYRPEPSDKKKEQ